MAMVELMTQLGTAVTALFLAWTMFQRYFPRQLRSYLEVYTQKFMSYVYPYIQITFPEFSNERLERSQAYTAITDYLSSKSIKLAKRLKADVVKDSSKSLVLSMEDNEEVVDEFNDVKVWWTSIYLHPQTQPFSIYPAADEKRYYKLTFHRRDRDVIIGDYIDHILKKGKEIAVANRQRKLYTNNPSKDWHGSKSGGKWSHVIFEHPATFDTLAMAKDKKEEIRKDLIKFSKGEEYYAKIGRAWKRGYLLYGPPGTGKSTMVAAMANLLGYDVYDVELTTVMDNTELKKLLIETTNKSIIVFEDIDCSIDLTGKRKPEKEARKDEDGEKNDPVSKKKKEDEEEGSKKSKVTLSGLLNLIDGIWSACGGERIFVFTTNYVEKLDPALIRRGRMDKHIVMSYCCFEAFKVLANNYIGIEYHELFSKIRELLEEVKMSPADVAENLMPKSDDEDEESYLRTLISSLEVAKEEAKKKSEEEDLKGEKVEKEDPLVTSDKEVKENGVMLVEEVKENGVGLES